MSRAVLTAPAVSSGSIWYTPNPSCGMCAPVLSSIVGTLVMNEPPLAICPKVRARFEVVANRRLLAPGTSARDDVEGVGVGAHPPGGAPVEAVDRRHVVIAEFEVEHREVLGDACRRHRLW